MQCSGKRIPFKLDFVLGFFATVLFYIAAILTMHLYTFDKHVFKMVQEESTYPFFIICKIHVSLIKMLGTFMNDTSERIYKNVSEVCVKELPFRKEYRHPNCIQRNDFMSPE